MFFNYNSPKPITRPEINNVTITIYNMAAVVGGTNTLLYDTDSSENVSTDMTRWSIIMCFSPVKSSIIPEMYNT
jgi:hypothetical protein